MTSNQSNEKPRLLIVGDYLFNPEAGQLTGPSGAHHINDRMAALLTCLINHSGIVVERDELVREFWPEEDDGARCLNQYMSRLRRYFGDSASSARYIVTIPNRGYRLVAPVFGSAPKPALVQTQFTLREPTCNRFVNFVREFRERKVCRSMLIYTLVIWLVFQISDVVVPALNLPEWVEPLVVVLGILGFPVAATLSWIFDLTPSGPVLGKTANSCGTGNAARKRSELVLDMVMVSSALVICSMLVVSSLDHRLLPLQDNDLAGQKTVQPVEPPLFAQNLPVLDDPHAAQNGR
jgi:DNA-binding winged helix-turn-helix (wHTH) protein